MLARDVYTDITDTDLDEAVKVHTDFNRRIGYRMMTARLKTQGTTIIVTSLEYHKLQITPGD